MFNEYWYLFSLSDFLLVLNLLILTGHLGVVSLDHILEHGLLHLLIVLWVHGDVLASIYLTLSKLSLHQVQGLLLDRLEPLLVTILL